jgi:hypothetical protein
MKAKDYVSKWTAEQWEDGTIALKTIICNCDVVEVEEYPNSIIISAWDKKEKQEVRFEIWKRDPATLIQFFKP